MWELTKSFRFEAAHSLSGTTFGAASEEIHGHSFRAEVTLRGTPDPNTGMVVDLGLLQRAIEDVRLTLDHKLLNKIEALGIPTLETSRASSGSGSRISASSPASASTATVATRAAPTTVRRVRLRRVGKA
jgi:6-pyruvoyl tetrahydropterin synthase/QueD family protein